MREKEIEQTLVKKVIKENGLCLKFISPSMTGIPDRIILLPRGKVGFVEVKRPGQKPRPIQVKRIEMLKSLGFKVYALDGKERIDDIIGEIRGD